MHTVVATRHSRGHLPEMHEEKYNEKHTCSRQPHRKRSLHLGMGAAGLLRAPWGGPESW